MRFITHRHIILTGMLALAGIHFAYASRTEESGDTVRIIDIEEITIVATPKEHTRLSLQPVASSLFDNKLIQQHHIESLKGVSNLTPNLFIPNYGSSLTSAIYIRGIGSRINSPAVGLYVNNIPYIDKSAFDFNLQDIERMDVLRGPQGTLYGRNTMGGLIRIHTRNPLYHQGTEVSLGASNGNNSGKISFTHRKRLNDHLAFSLGGYSQEIRGAFRNSTRQQWADPKRAGGAQLRTVWLPNKQMKIDFTASYDYTDEGGYAYRYLGAINPEEEIYTDEIGKISNNQPNGYWRSLLNTGVNIEWQQESFILNATTGYQHVNDCMFIDQDFLSADIFTLRQSQRQRTLSQEVSIKNKPGKRWQHTTGMFFFYQWLKTEAPVTFLKDGINMIKTAMDNGMTNSPIQIQLGCDTLAVPGVFETPTWGTALFHQSEIELTDRLKATIGMRLNYEKALINYDTGASIQGIMNGNVGGMEFNNAPFTQTIRYNDKHRKEFIHLLPKIALSYQWAASSPNRIYASVSKGLRSGGYNIQMFSEIVQTRFRQPGDNSKEVKGLITYHPEQSWNYETGMHLNLCQGMLQADAALFYITTTDQQISRFTPNGLGRIMVNAGEGESYGVELSLRTQPTQNISAFLNYGYTHATFSKYDGGTNENNEKIDYAGNYIPFAPQHTLNFGGEYTFFMPQRKYWKSISLKADLNGAGRIYWTEDNNIYQNFYHTVNAGITLKGKKTEVAVWGKNLTNNHYDTFCFESMDRLFAQRALPRQWGFDIRVKF